jgi:hypothetical protein
MQNLDQELIYEDLKVRYKIIYSKNIKDILVYIKGLPVAVGLLQFLELIAVMEGFLANQLPPKKERYAIAIKGKIPYLSLYVKKYDRRIFLDKAEVRVYLKILKQFEKKIDIFTAGEKQTEELII